MAEDGASPTPSQTQSGASTTSVSMTNAIWAAGTWREARVIKRYCRPIWPAPSSRARVRSRPLMARSSASRKQISPAKTPARQVAGIMSTRRPALSATMAVA